MFILNTFSLVKTSLLSLFSALRTALVSMCDAQNLSSMPNR